ncbi:MAG: PQQ-dependent sugar dehydrogenase [Jatrophihabitans sp.]
MSRLRLPRLAASLAAVLLLGAAAACGAGASGSTPSWTPQPDYQGNNDPNPQLSNPGIPAPSLPGSAVPQPPTGPSGGGSAPSGPSPASDPNVVATKLVEPTGLVVLPDGTALVGERRSGRIYRVQPQAGQPATLVQTLVGVNGSGDGGLLDLAISPSYDQDGLIYAYLSTATDNRVVHFALGSAPSTVIGGIPHGSTGNTGRIAFDATGALLTGTGDAGQPALAASATSLAGKILRTDDIGKPLADNPSAGSRVYARGVHGADGLTGLCVDPQSGARIAISGDTVLAVTSGADYSTDKPAASLPATARGAGGCALACGQLLVASATGKALAVAPIAGNSGIGEFAVHPVGDYGRLRTVVAGSDGALWLTTRNRDGHGSPIATDDRVIRITDLDVSSPVV